MRKPHPLQKRFFDNIDAIHSDLMAGTLLSDMAVKYGIKYSTISLNAKKLWGFKPRRGKIPYSGPCVECGDATLYKNNKRCKACVLRRNLLARGGGKGKVRGENHPWWKGGKSLQNPRMTSEYQKWRKSVFERDKYTCVKCGKLGGSLSADHIIPFWFVRDNIPELLYLVKNGRTLCTECHKNTETFAEKAKQFHKILAQWYINYIQEHAVEAERAETA